MSRGPLPPAGGEGGSGSWPGDVMTAAAAAHFYVATAKRRSCLSLQHERVTVSAT